MGIKNLKLKWPRLPSKSYTHALGIGVCVPASSLTNISLGHKHIMEHANDHGYQANTGSDCGIYVSNVGIPHTVTLVDMHTLSCLMHGE